MIEGQDKHRHHVIEDMEGEFEVRPEHLVSVCDAVLDDKVEAEYLRLIGFCIVASDAFEYDTESRSRRCGGLTPYSDCDS